ncbi:MAG: PAS domain-containing protein [Actinomycetota bacterium]
MRTDPSEEGGRRRRGLRDLAAALVAGLTVLVLCIVLNIPAHVRELSRAHPLFHADLVLAILAAVTVALAVVSLLRSQETQRQTSARGQAESALIESERRYRDLVDLSPDAILVHADGRFVFANRAAARLLGAEDPSGLTGKPVLEVVHPDYRRVVQQRIQDEASGRPAPLLEQRFVRLDGRVIDVEVAGIPIAYGDATGGQIVIRDITDRKRAEVRLQEAESRFRTLVERVPAVTYIWDARNPTGAVEADYISPQVESLLGYTQEEWQRNPGLWEQHVHPDDREPVLAEWERASRTGKPFAADYRFTSRDGRAMWIRDEATLLSRDERGDPALYQGVMIEVTEQHRAEEQAREAEARYRTLVEQLPVVIYVQAVDDHGTPLYVSPQYERLLGYTAQERMTDPLLWTRLVHPDDLDRVRAESERTARTGEDFSIEYRLIAKDGHTVWVRDEAVLVRDDADGTAVTWQGVLIDLTARREAERILERQDAILRAVGFAAERFLRTAAWEESIDEVLGRLGRAAGASRAYVYENTAGEGGEPLMSMRYEWVDDDVDALMNDETSLSYPYRPNFERWERELGGGRTFSGPVSGFPEAEREMLASADILSTAFVPIRPGGETWGFVGFDDCREPRTWSQAEIDALRTAAETLSAAIARQHAEEDVRETQAKYRTLIEQIPAITYMTEYGQSTVAQYVSPQVEALLGFSAEEWRSTPGMWQSRIHPDDRERVLAEDERTERSGETFIQEYRMVARDDSVVWVRDEAVLLRDADGNPQVWQGVRMDITARKLAEQQLREAEEKYRTLVERIPAITYTAVMGEGAPWLYVSPQVESILGFTQQEWVENPRIWLEQIHPDDVDRVMAEENRSRDTLRALVSEYRMITRDGRVVWLRDEAEVVADADGTPQFLSGVMLDITDRKTAEEQLRETEAKYRAMVEHIPAVLYIDLPDEAMTPVYVSPQIEKVLGVTAQEYVDEDVWEEYLHPQDRDRAIEEALRGVSGSEPFSIEYRMRRRDGRETWIRDEAVVLRDEEGAPTFVQGVMFDITERKLAEQALQESERREREAAEQLRDLDDMKNTVLAAVSHELRSPLTSILGLALTLERHNLEAEDETDLLARLSANARKLDRLLKDLLDIDRLNRGILSPQLRPMDIGALVRRTIEAMETLGERHILVESDAIVIPVDPPKIERIVENLVANAAKHTSSDAAIWVRVEQEPEGVLIVVEDDGAGVPEGLRDDIFEPFRQGPTESPHAPGTGIGLSLVARFAELHGGRAWVEERDGGGASFRVFLPSEHAEPAASGDRSTDRRSDAPAGAEVVPHPADRLRGDGAHGSQPTEPTALPADRFDERGSRAG